MSQKNKLNGLLLLISVAHEWLFNVRNSQMISCWSSHFAVFHGIFPAVKSHSAVFPADFFVCSHLAIFPGGFPAAKATLQYFMAFFFFQQ